MSDASLIASTREFVPIRLDQTKDQWAWREYKITGIGVFLVLDNEAEQHAEIPMIDNTRSAVVRSFTSTLGKAWKELEDDVKRIAWQPSLDKAKAIAAKTRKPIALFLTKVKKSKGKADPKATPKPDAKGQLALAALGGREVAIHFERYVWVRVDWTDAKPAIAKTYGLSRAPALALIEADGKKVSARVTRFHPVKLPRTLAKVAKKAEAKAERDRKRNARKR